MAPMNVVLKAIVRGRTKPFLRKGTKIKDPSSITLGKAFHDAITSVKPDTQFSENDIVKIETSREIDVTDYILDPIQEAFNCFETGERELVATVEINLSAQESIRNRQNLTPFQIIRQSGVISTKYLDADFSMEDIHKFQQEFKAASNKEEFKKSYMNKPDYNAQFTTVIKQKLIDAKLGYETVADKVILEKAILTTVDAFKFIHGQRAKLERNTRGLFKTFILQNTIDAVESKMKSPPKRAVILTEELLKGWMDKINTALAKWPDVYHKLAEGSMTARVGEAILTEVENLVMILDKHLEGLWEQRKHNRHTYHKEEGRKPGANFTKLEIKKGMP